MANEEQVNVLSIDNTKARESQISKIKHLKQVRNEQETLETLKAITECCSTGQGNLLELSVRAARARAT